MTHCVEKLSRLPHISGSETEQRSRSTESLVRVKYPLQTSRGRIHRIYNNDHDPWHFEFMFIGWNRFRKTGWLSGHVDLLHISAECLEHLRQYLEHCHYEHNRRHCLLYLVIAIYMTSKYSHHPLHRHDSRRIRRQKRGRASVKLFLRRPLCGQLRLFSGTFLVG